MKHDEPMDAMQQYFDDSNQLENTNPTLPMKHFPLKSIPLYHAHYHQHTHNASNGLLYETAKGKASIRKRASAGEKLSTNITMVLESLLK